MTETQQRFMQRAIRRKRLFLWLSAIGVAVGAGLAGWLALGGGGDAGALHWVVVVLVLLNARQNLRQYRYAGVLETLMQRGG